MGMDSLAGQQKGALRAQAAVRVSQGGTHRLLHAQAAIERPCCRAARSLHAQAAIERPCCRAARSLHAQAAIEMVSYAGFFLLAFVAMVVVFLQLQSTELSRAEHAFAQEIAYDFADRVHVAFVAGPGFVQNVTIPQSLLGKPYMLLVSGKKESSPAPAAETGFVYVDWQGPTRRSSFSAATVTAAYSEIASGNFITVADTPGGDKLIIINASVSQRLRVENIGGVIRISGA